MAGAVESVVAMQFRGTFAYRDRAQLAAIFAPDVAVGAEAAAVLADAVGRAGPEAGAVLRVIEVVVGLADARAVDARLLTGDAGTIATAVVGVVAVDLRITDALAFDTRLQVAALLTTATVVGVGEVLLGIAAVAVDAALSGGTGTVAAAVVGVEGVKGGVTATAADAGVALAAGAFAVAVGGVADMFIRVADGTSVILGASCKQNDHDNPRPDDQGGQSCGCVIKERKVYHLSAVRFGRRA